MRLFQSLNNHNSLSTNTHSTDFYALRYKFLMERHKNQSSVLDLCGFFIRDGNKGRLLPSFQRISLTLFSGLTDSVVKLSDVVELSHIDTLVTNHFKFFVTNHTQTSKSLIGLRLGLVIKYTKLSKRIRKNLRGKQRYKAYLILLNDKKTQGSVIRLYNLLSLTLSETRDYESYADLSLFYSELFFSQLSYDMIYTQVQKLMLQSYVDNGGRAVVPNILDAI